MQRVEAPRGFPLGQWVLAHSGVRHNLSLSGMGGALTSVPRLLKRPPAADSDSLRALLAELHSVAPAEVFLTHGAHEANFLALAFLSSESRRDGRRFTVRVDAPEYPPFVDLAGAVGASRIVAPGRASVWLLSNPNNPTGTWRSRRQLLDEGSETGTIVVDEAFREFTDAASMAATADQKFWVTGTFTKVYGADEIRVGWSIPPGRWRAAYARFHPVASDRLAERSVRSAVAILRARPQVLRESRGIFQRNVKALPRVVTGRGALAAPLWFDRGRAGLPGDAVQAAALRRSVLVSSGSFFGDPHGIRICLTRHTFPRDLARYLEVRALFTGP